MSIKFACPHCKEPLSVKDHFAGKKGKCPKCKKVLTVPAHSTPQTVAPAPQANGAAKPPQPTATPPPPPRVDVEADAAAALADEPPQESVAREPQFVECTCDYCEAELRLDAQLAGKKTSCPECKRIIKVPELKKVEKKDWRKAKEYQGPSGARRPEEAAPEGAWGSATSSSTVSQSALLEADVLPGAREPLTMGRIVTRVVLGVAAVVAVAVGAWWAYSWWSSAREQKALQAVEDYAASKPAQDRIGREGQAALYVALGEYYVRAQRPGGAEEAQARFRKAIDTLTPQTEADVNPVERDAVLADLALIQCDLGGNKDEVEKGSRVTWNEVQKSVGATLRAMRSAEARPEAVRAVCRKLIAKGQPERAVAVAAQSADGPAERSEALGAAGLELLAANLRPQAESAANQALALVPAAEDRPPTLTAPAVALATVLKLELPKATSAEEENLALGEAEGLARLGQWDAARGKVGALGPTAQARGRVALAAAALDGKTNDNADLDAALRLAAGLPDQPQLKLRLARLALRAGVAGEPLETLIASITERDVRGLGRLEALRQRLTGSKQTSDDTSFPEEEKPPLASYLAREELARHNARLDGGWSKSIQKWDEPARAFGSIGAMLGAAGG